MANLELTVSPDYVQNWGVSEALRELFQNAEDANDAGYDRTVKYLPNQEMLVIRNEGVSMGRDKLILGNSGKRGVAGMRGKFGEGFKLAAVVLTRRGCGVTIKSGSESWKFSIGASTAFDGAHVLKVKTAKASYENCVRVRVTGITVGDWEAIQGRLLFLTPPDEARTAKVPRHGSVLFEDKYHGSLYNRGIYVGKMPDEYRFGYDLDSVELDRDRKLADPWSLKYGITKLLSVGCEAGVIGADLIMEMLDSDCGEARAVGDYATYASGMGEKVAALFKEEHGDAAAPVESMGDSIEAEHHGLKGVVVKPALRKVLETALGGFDDRKVTKGTEAAKVYGYGDLTDEERKTFVWACYLLVEHGGVEKASSRVRVVDFHGSNVRGTYQGGAQPPVSLARKCLASRRVTLTTLAHEFAHQWGADATVEHREANDRILGDIICGLG